MLRKTRAGKCEEEVGRDERALLAKRKGNATIATATGPSAAQARRRDRLMHGVLVISPLRRLFYVALRIPREIDSKQKMDVANKRGQDTIERCM